MDKIKPIALVTGSSGFIGYHCCKLLLQDGFRVIGIDAHTDYYDVALKEKRCAMLLETPEFTFSCRSIDEPEFLSGMFEKYRPEIVVHLAAQAGVRHSVENPRLHLHSNVDGVFELLEAARKFTPNHLLLASSSSVYGSNSKTPYAENDSTEHQLSFYAATKKSMEVMAHSYAHLYQIPTTICRFFTVYGPWGRPDMAVSKFASAMFDGKPIDVYNYGKSSRDFTFIDDLISALRLLIDVAPTPTDAAMPTAAPYQVVNIGSSQPTPLETLICSIENAVDTTALRNLLPLQAGDVPATWADTGLLKQLIDYVPNTKIDDGIAKYVAWHKSYYRTDAKTFTHDSKLLRTSLEQVP
ncbi:NAD-dependent epimerase/dehydratase family protein [Maritalea sp.]|uniref:NAD-dependent epimerase/dehydratase family protein n=1 Tax=Maritalea sp. TaxID=2003361 RepID=UPI003EFACCA0